MKFNPVIAESRNAFLLLLKLNAAGLAPLLYRAAKTESSNEWKKLSAFWKKIGGNPDILRHAVKQGLRVEYKHHRSQHAEAEAVFNFEGFDQVEPVTTGVATATALPIIAKVMKLLKSIGVDPKDVEDKLKGLGNKGLEKLAKEHTGKVTELPDGSKEINLALPAIPNHEKGASNGGENNNVLIIGAVALVVGYFALKGGKL